MPEQKPDKKPELKWPKGFLVIPAVGIGIIFLMGAALILWPEALLAVLPPFIGIILLTSGVIAVISSFSVGGGSGMRVMLGVVTAVVGLVFLVKQDMSLVFLSVLFGLYVLITAGMGFVEAVQAMRAHEPWVMELLQAILETILGFLLLFSPFSGLSIWVQVLGIHFLVLAASGFIWLYRLWKMGNKLL